MSIFNYLFNRTQKSEAEKYMEQRRQHIGSEVQYMENYTQEVDLIAETRNRTLKRWKMFLVGLVVTILLTTAVMVTSVLVFNFGIVEVIRIGLITTILGMSILALLDACS